MKKFITFLAALFLCAGTSFGTIVQIGSGTATSENFPIAGYWGYSYTQQIYTQAQMLNTGTINKIRFYLSSGAPVTNSSDWVVYLGHTPKTAFSSTTDWVPLGSMTQVFSGAVTFPANGNWMEITLLTPFLYNNVDNLVVAVDENTPAYSGNDVFWSSFTSGTNTGIYYRNDYTNPNPASPPSATDRSSNINQVQFDMETLPCSGTPSPGNTISSANPVCPGVGFTLTLQNFTPGLGVSYQWESSANGTIWVPAGSTSASYTTFLVATTWYRCNVTCSGNTGTSIPLLVTTSGYPAFPFTESFNTIPFPPACWSAVSMSRETTGSNPTCTPHSGAAMVRFNSYSISSGGTGTLITPVLNIPGDNYWVKFWMYRDATFPTRVDKVNIWYNNAPEIAGANLLGSVNRPISSAPVVTSQGWYEYSFPFGMGSAGALKYIILQAVSDYGNNIFLDDVTVEQFTSGTLQGVITDCFSGAELPNAIISAGPFTTTSTVNGSYQLTGISPGTHNITVTKAGYLNATASGVVVVSNQTTTQNICMNVVLPPPLNLQASVNNLNNVHLQWLAPPVSSGFYDGFESYNDFTLNFPPWTNIDLDGLPTYGFSGYTWPNQFAPQAFQVFNPGTTTPPMTSPVQAHNGEKFAACWNAYSTSSNYNNDWLITPQIEIAAGYVLKFWARSYDDLYGLERIKVGISTTGMNITDFTILSTAPYISVPVTWTQYTFDLSAYAGQNIYIAINCVSEDAFFLSLDDLSVGVPTSAPGNSNNNTIVRLPEVDSPALTLTGYKVYRNNAVIANNLTPLFFDDQGLAPGNYTYKVTALYPQGESLPAGPVSLEIITCYPPIALTVSNTTTGGATLSWTPGTNASTNWIVEWGAKGFTPGTGTLVMVSVNPSTTLAGLTAGGEYDYYVRADCGTMLGMSTWAGPKSFRVHFFACSEGSTAEAEACGNEQNDGCNMTSPAFEPIGLGQTICGTAWYDGSTRDSDWFTFTLTQTMDVALTGKADFELFMVFSNSPCPGSTIISATGAAGATVTMFKNLAPGTYYAIAAPTFASIVECGGGDRYMITINGTTCFAPTALGATNITVSSASLGWTSAASLWNIEYGPAGFVKGTGTVLSGITQNPYTLNGLSSSTSYNYYIQSDCGAGGVSAWAGPYTFNTLCGPIPPPFGPVNFDGTFAPYCWTRYLGLLAATSSLSTTSAGWTQDDWRNVTSPVNKAAKLNIYSTFTKHWLMTPQINLGTGTSYQLEFDLVITDFTNSSPPESTGSDDKFAIVISTDGGATWTSANTLRLWNNTGSPYVFNNISSLGEHIVISLAAYSGVVKIGFYGESTVTNSDNDLMIDNVKIVVPGAVVPANYTATGSVPAGQTQCFNATNTITVSNFTVHANNGYAEFIAGQNILLEPGTVVQLNAKMWAHITTSNTYCTPTNLPIVATLSGQEQPLISSHKGSFFIFPNPTTGNFTLVKKGEKEFEKIRVEVYAGSGGKLMSVSMAGFNQREFGFADMPGGLYFIKVIADDYVETIKLVKTQ